jgi:hypothetical protein
MRWRLFIAASLSPMIVACAPLQPVSTSALSPDQSELINTTCTNVMGFREGEAYYLDCQDSLAHSLARKIKTEASVIAEDTCRKNGLTSGSSAFAICALNEQNAAAARIPVRAMPIADIGPANTVLQSGKSYYNVSPRVQFQRERYACARLGLVPGSGLFGICTASLEGAFMPDD